MNEHIQNRFDSNSTFSEIFDELFYHDFKLNKYIYYKDLERNTIEVIFDKIKKKLGCEEKHHNFSLKTYKIIAKYRNPSIFFDILSFKTFEEMYSYSENFKGSPYSNNFCRTYEYYALFIDETNLSNLDFEIAVRDDKKYFVFFPTDKYYINVNNRRR